MLVRFAQASEVAQAHLWLVSRHASVCHIGSKENAKNCTEKQR